MANLVAAGSEVERPDWLNEEFFVEIYAKDEKFADKQFTTKIQSCSSVVEIGDNYTSTMYRVNVELTRDGAPAQTDNFIVKAMIHMVEAFKEFSIFPIEIEAYEQALPAFEGYWRDIGQDVVFGPKCLHTISDLKEIIVLSDLKPQGFVMANRFEGLDLEHAKLLLSKLAKFHAASVIYKEKNGKFGPKLNRQVFEPKMKKVFEGFTSGNFPVFLKFLNSSEHLKQYHDIAEKWRHNMFERLLRVSNVTDDTPDFCVLNHSDMWINNHMFKYDENNRPVDVVFIDFQMSHWGRPAVDLQYFLFSSVRPEIVVAEFDTLIAHYHSVLVDSLKVLGSKKTPPLLRDLHIQILECCCYGSMCFSGITAVSIMDKNENASLENFFNEGDAGDKMRMKMYFNPRLEHKLRLLLPFCAKRGLLDTVEIPESEIIPVEEDPPVPAASAADIPATEDAKSVSVNGIQANGVEESPTDKAATKDVNGVIASQTTMSPNETSQKEEAPKNAIPKWLNKFFFNDMLRKEFESFRVIRVSIAPATGKGENYASVMYRVKLQLENKEKNIVQKSFIVKTIPDLGIHQEMLKQFNVFPKEIEMYSNIIPAFEKMYENAGVKITFGPRCLLAGFEPTDVIVMEDMIEKNFTMANRKVGLDLEHCELLLGKLAKFHAASVVYREKNGPYKDCFKEGIYSEKMKPMFEQFYQASQQLFVDVAAKWNLTPKFTNTLLNMKDDLMEKVFKVVKEDPNFFNCLNHGDMWCNNSMFKYDSTGKVKDVILVDYQMCQYASPVIDLNYFIFTSCHKDIKLAKLDYLVQYYHTNLVSSLKLLNSTTKPPTLLELQIEMLKKMYYGVSSVIGTFAICVADASDESEMETFMRTDEKATEFKMKVYTNPTYVNALKELVPFFEAKGLLD
uniref:Putative ecdysteroid kinase n=1 Tax=Nyssomyia neivai TaxID=330878 RepID=A0A1L8DYN9_9DIPT